MAFAPPIDPGNYDILLSLQENRSVEGVIDSLSFTPSNTDGFTKVVDGKTQFVRARWFYLGVSGNVVVKKIDGTNQTYLNMAAGIYHPIHCIGILATGTTATDIVWGN